MIEIPFDEIDILCDDTSDPPKITLLLHEVKIQVEDGALRDVIQKLGEDRLKSCMSDVKTYRSGNIVVEIRKPRI